VIGRAPVAPRTTGCTRRTSRKEAAPPKRQRAWRAAAASSASARGPLQPPSFARGGGIVNRGWGARHRPRFRPFGAVGARAAPDVLRKTPRTRGGRRRPWEGGFGTGPSSGLARRAGGIGTSTAERLGDLHRQGGRGGAARPASGAEDYPRLGPITYRRRWKHRPGSGKGRGPAEPPRGRGESEGGRRAETSAPQARRPAGERGSARDLGHDARRGAPGIREARAEKTGGPPRRTRFFPRYRGGTPAGAGAEGSTWEEQLPGYDRDGGAPPKWPPGGREGGGGAARGCGALRGGRATRRPAS